MSKGQKRALVVMALVMVLVIGGVVLWAVVREDTRTTQAAHDLAGVYADTP